MEIDTNLICDYIIRYGKDNQTTVCIEELSELIKEITKMKRNKGSMSHLAEEMADCYICLEQLKIIYGIYDDELQKQIAEKEFRNRRRLNGQY